MKQAYTRPVLRTVPLQPGVFGSYGHDGGDGGHDGGHHGGHDHGERRHWWWGDWGR